MLNWAVRYYPILRILESEGLLERGSLLEIGSGSVGIGRFRNVPFIGCDIAFQSEPQPPMFPIEASAAALPFADATFDVVLSSDVLEHVPPSLREKVISESLRVAKSLAIFAFPCGQAAWDLDYKLREAYKEARLPVPVWLDEHMLADFPGPEAFAGLKGWSVEQFGNDNLKFHDWLMRKEMSYPFCRFSSACMRVAPSLIESALSKANVPPYYRQVFVLRRQNYPMEKSIVMAAGNRPVIDDSPGNST